MVFVGFFLTNGYKSIKINPSSYHFQKHAKSSAYTPPSLLKPCLPFMHGSVVYNYCFE